MKFKMLFLGLCLTVGSSAFAANQHVHPQTPDDDKKPQEISMKWAGYCEIEVVNSSSEDVRVSGIFDDGVWLQPFNVYGFESPHYISLYYYGYCHAGMNLMVDTWSGYPIFSGYVEGGSTLRILPYLTNRAKAEVRAR